MVYWLSNSGIVYHIVKDIMTNAYYVVYSTHIGVNSDVMANMSINNKNCTDYNTVRTELDNYGVKRGWYKFELGDDE